MADSLETLSAALECLDAGGACALCVIVGKQGSAPQAAGATYLVFADGRTHGTVGGGCLEAELRRRAAAMLHDGRSGLAHFDLDSDYGWDDGLICGGSVQIAVRTICRPSQAEDLREAAALLRRGTPAAVLLRLPHEQGCVEYRLNLEPTPVLLIAGAGHVGRSLAALASSLDYRVVVFDDRGDLLGPERFPPPIETVAGPIDARLRGWPIDANTCVAIVTRGHAHDAKALAAVVDSPAGYVGMIGSRRKIRVVFDELESRGVSPERLARVHSPIGLSIGAVTVAEIAVSIVAELIQVRRAQTRRAVEGPRLLSL